MSASNGDTVTINDMIQLSGLNRVSLLKVIGTRLQPVGRAVPVGRGRPANLYDRQSFLDLMGDRAGRSMVVSTGNDQTLSVDEIDRLVDDVQF